MTGSMIVAGIVLLITIGGALLAWVSDLIAGDS